MKDKNEIATDDIRIITDTYPSNDNLILTNEGYKRLSEIKVGDKVVSCMGGLQTVTSLFDGNTQKTYALRGLCMDETNLPGESKLLVREKYSKYEISPDGKKGYKRHFKNAEWKTLNELISCPKEGGIKNYYLGCPINTKAVIPEWDGITVCVSQHKMEKRKTLDMSSADFWYIVGRYLGDGWLRKQQKPGKFRAKYSGFIICCGKNEVEELKAKIPPEYHYSVVNERTVCKLHFCNTEFAFFLEQFGMGAENKYVPGFVLDLPVDLLASFLNGYFDSDGCEIKNEKCHLMQATTISRKLVYGIAQCVHKVYKIPCDVHKSIPNRICKIEGRTVNEKPTYMLRYRVERKRIYSFYEDGYIWYPITAAVASENKVIHGIKTDGSYPFIVNGCVLCDLAS